MRSMAAPTSSELVALIEQVYGSCEGSPVGEVAMTERRLGVALPRVLRETYLSAGRMVRLWAACERGCWQVRGLGGLRVEEDLLVLASEQQGAFEWAVQVDAGDEPMVFEGSEGAWEATPESLGSFLRGIVLFHTSSATMDWEGGVELPRDRLERYLRGWLHTRFRTLCTTMDFYVRGTSVVRCDWRADAARVFMGGADQAALEVCAAAL
jgi:hypothetical protein